MLIVVVGKIIPDSHGNLFDRQWTITTLSTIAEVAKLDNVSPNNEYGFGWGPLVVKSGGKNNIACSANDDPLLRDEKGEFFSSFRQCDLLHSKDPKCIRCKSKHEETHKTDVSF